MSNLKNIPLPFFKRIFLLLVILVGLALNVFLIGSVTVFKSSAATDPVEIFFTPGTADIPPQTTFKVMIDPRSQTISFSSIKIYFDPALLRLTSEVDTSSSPYTGRLTVTSMSEANSTGFITIILFQEVGQPVPTNQTFEFAKLTFTSAPGSVITPTEITVVDEDTQLVDSKSQELDYTALYADINAVEAVVPMGGGAVPGLFFKLFRGNCSSDDYIDTAIGCIPYNDTNALAKFFLAWGMGVGAGIAFILIVYSGFIIITSSGNPQRLASAKELLTAAIAGLIMIIGAAFILRLIGVDILGILT